MKPQLTPKTTWIAIGAVAAIGTLIGSNIVTYKNAYSKGYKTSITESRKGYMQVPEVSGSIVVAKVKGKKTHYFEPYPTTPSYNSKLAWNSEENRKYLEWSIQNNAQIEGEPVSYRNVGCAPQTSANFWTCTMRRLGTTHNQTLRVEVNPTNGKWQSSW